MGKIKSAKMLKRGGFTPYTKRTIGVAKGQHRRHIISHHLMMSALETWIEVHKATGNQVTRLKQLLQLMNNYLPNLHPGDGAVNTAIGMLTNNMAKKLESGGFGTPKDLGEALGDVKGFQQQTQLELIEPVLTAFKTDDIISQEMEGATTFGKNLVDSTDFDWPEGADPSLYETWHEMYLVFLQLRNNAGDYAASGVARVCEMFLQLPDPCNRGL